MVSSIIISWSLELGAGSLKSFLFGNIKDY